jgi:glycerol-1-phosphate dehydrogenase [NAD(P)+]
MPLLPKLDEAWKCKCGKHSMPPVRVQIGFGATNKIPALLNDLEFGSNGLIVDDVNTRNVAGAKIAQELRQHGFSVSEVIVDKPDEDNVGKVEREIQGDYFVIGVGGTSVLDIVKLSAERKQARYMLFSTGLANSGIVSRTASIYVHGRKESFPTKIADAVVVDLTVVSAAPVWMFGAGFGDLIIEATAIKDWQLGRDEVNEPYCESIADLEIECLDEVLGNIDSIGSRTPTGVECLVDALVVAGLGMAMWGSSRPSSGSEHMWSHWLEHYAEQNSLPQGRHGEQVAIGTLLMAKYHGAHNPNWWDKEKHPAYQAESLMQSLKKVQAPSTLQEIGVTTELAIEAFVGAWEYRKDRYTILHKRNPSRNDAKQVIEKLAL